MIEFFQLVFRSFWTFIGFVIILALCLEFVLKIWNRSFRHWNIRKHGYPPIHCDADGDFKKEND